MLETLVKYFIRFIKDFINSRGIVIFTYLFWGLCGIYILGWLFCTISFFKTHEKLHSIGELLLTLGLVVQFIYIGSTFFTTKSLPFYSLAGLLLFLSLLVILIYFFLDYIYHNDIFEVIFPPLAVFFLLLSNLISDQSIITPQFITISPLAGKIFLFIHASFSMLGYLLFQVACLTSIFFLYQENKIKSKKMLLTDGKLPSLGFLDWLNYKVVSFGFLFLTLGLLVGVSMKLILSGGYSGVSVRLIVPLLTWAVYAVILLDRSIRGLRGKITAIWAIIGFITAVGSFIYEMEMITE